MSQTGVPVSIEKRLQVLRVIWAVMIMSVLQFALIGYITGTGEGFTARDFSHLPEGFTAVTGSIGIGLYVLGILLVSLAAPLALRKFLRRAERERDPAHVQTGLVLAFALCEMSALFGLIILFTTGSLNAFLQMAVGAVGIAAHYPRRSYFDAATTYQGAAAGGQNF